jgi:ABC-type amino acid transport system permease subunit
VFQGTPLLMQLFVVYYALALAGLRLEAWQAVAIGFTLHASAYLGEIWRGSIEAVPRGQMEAAKALSLGYVSRMKDGRHVLLDLLAAFAVGHAPGASACDGHTLSRNRCRL